LKTGVAGSGLPGVMRLAEIVTIALALIFVAFGSPSGEAKAGNNLPPVFDKVLRDSIGFVALPYDKLPNAFYFSLEESSECKEPFDADSIELWLYKGGAYYHPTYLSHRAEGFMGAFYTSRNRWYLNRAELYARKVMSMCLMYGDTAYVVCRFPYAVHGDSSIFLHPPWVSGMSQGELLMTVVRLYEFTGNAEYLEFAHELFNAFLRLKGEAQKWIARIDDSGYYWIEEYPHDEKPGMTLNGFLSAVFGIYDYYRVTGDPRGKAVYDMALTTVKHYLPYYRRENEPSLYCLGHNHRAKEGYHFLHVQQLDWLYSMTGDDFFKDWRDKFESDGVYVYRTNSLVKAARKVSEFFERLFSH
jgi:hypothetical protein